MNGGPNESGHGRTECSGKQKQGKPIAATVQGPIGGRERLTEWEAKWAELKAEAYQIRENWRKTKREMAELEERCHEALKLNDEELRKMDFREIFEERARLRAEKSKMEAEVERIDEEITRRVAERERIVGQKEFVSTDKVEARVDENKQAESSGDLVDGELHEKSRDTTMKEIEIEQAKAELSSSEKQGEVVARRRMRCWSCGGPHTKKVCPSRRRRQTAKRDMITQSHLDRIRSLSRRLELMEKKRPKEGMDAKEAEFLKQVSEDRHNARSKKDDGSLKSDLVNVVVQEKRVATLNEGRKPHREQAEVKRQNREMGTGHMSLTTRHRPDIQERVKKWRGTQKRCSRQLEKDRGPNRRAGLTNEGEPPDLPPSGLA